MVAWLVIGLAVTPARAERWCSVPLADWQPRDALVQRLATDGWTVVSIRSDDGCYKVVARNARGEMMKGKFDPATLERVTDRHHEHGDDDH